MRVSARFIRLAAQLWVVTLIGLVGCSSAPVPTAQSNYSPTDTITINEGDVLKITFPSARGLDTTQEVRRDGRIAMAHIGEVSAAGLTPAKLANQLAELYSPELVSREVTVTVVSSSFEVIVSGAVTKPGKILSKRPLTAFEAVMEAGGFDNEKADMKKVVVVRRDGSKVTNFRLDLSRVLDGSEPEAFFLKPFDVVYVPTVITWF